jgi:hypothetical protein
VVDLNQSQLFLPVADNLSATYSEGLPKSPDVYDDIKRKDGDILGSSIIMKYGDVIKKYIILLLFFCYYYYCYYYYYYYFYYYFYYYYYYY